MNWFWHALWIAFVLIPLALLWGLTVMDIILRPGMSVLGRFAWLIVVLALPLFGALIYLLSRPTTDRIELPGPRAFTGPSGSLSGDLAKLGDLHRDGVLNATEFAQAKAKLLGTATISV